MRLFKVRTEGRTDPESPESTWSGVIFQVGEREVTELESDDVARMVTVTSRGYRRLIPYERVAFMVPDARPAEAKEAYVQVQPDELAVRAAKRFYASEPIPETPLIVAVTDKLDPVYRHPNAKGKR